MNLEIIQTVQRLLADTPKTGEAISKLAGLTFEETYRALVWLYDRSLAEIARKPSGSEVAGWIARTE